MSRKNTILVLLVVCNLVLLSAVLLSAMHGPAAYAQQATMPANYIAIAAEVQNGYDAVYLIDLNKRRLNLLLPARGGRTVLELLDSRDLTRDFRVKVHQP